MNDLGRSRRHLRVTGQTVDETCSSPSARIPRARIDKRVDAERVRELRIVMTRMKRTAPIRTAAAMTTPVTPPTHPVPRRNPTRTGTGVDERYCRTSMRSVFFATTLRPSVTWKVRR